MKFSLIMRLNSSGCGLNIINKLKINKNRKRKEEEKGKRGVY